jgi:hypothetical protein
MGKKNKKNEELKRFSVETTSTFYEVHIVHAKNEEEAKLIAASADYNFSKWLGQNFINVREAKDKDIEQFREMDPYFFEGAAKIDEDSFVVYTDIEGKDINENMPKEVLVTK